MSGTVIEILLGIPNCAFNIWGISVELIYISDLFHNYLFMLNYVNRSDTVDVAALRKISSGEPDYQIIYGQHLTSVLSSRNLELYAAAHVLSCIGRTQVLEISVGFINKKHNIQYIWKPIYSEHRFAQLGSDYIIIDLIKKRSNERVQN